MPSDQCNSITAKASDLIFSLLDVTLAREVPFGIPQYEQCILQGLTSVHPLLIVATFQTLLDSYCCEHSSQRRAMDTSVSDDNWGALHHCSGYLDYGHTFRTVLDSYCCVMGST